MSNKTNTSVNNDDISDSLSISGKEWVISDLEKNIKTLEIEVTKAKDVIREKVDDLILKKVALRIDSIKKQFDKFIARKPNLKDAVYLNQGLLLFAVKSYYDDIHRYKDYCGSTWANSHKQTAYTIKWIAKFKPIQIKQEFDNVQSLDDEILLDINLIFALICGFSFLDKKIIKLISNDKKQNGEQSFYNKLLYNLRYRYYTGKQLISVFEALEINANNVNG